MRRDRHAVTAPSVKARASRPDPIAREVATFSAVPPDGAGTPALFGFRRQAQLSGNLALLGLCTLACLCLLAAFATPSQGACPNDVFRTGPSAKLPECRAYELVTPVDTAGLPPSAGDFLEEPQVFDWVPLAPSGNEVIFNTQGGALPGTPGGGTNDRYRARRTADGWVTEFDGVPGSESEQAMYGGSSEDIRYYAMEARNPWLTRPLDGVVLHTPNGFETLAKGSLGEFPRISRGDGIRQISPNGEHVIFQASVRLEPQAPVDKEVVYDRTPGGPTRVVSLLPGDQTPSTNSRYLGATHDGSEVAFETHEREENNSNGRYYVRRNNTTTQEVIRPGGVFVGDELECEGASEPGATLAYHWLRDGVRISGAASSTYTVTTEDEGSLLQCELTASKGSGTSLDTSGTWPAEPFDGSRPPEIKPEFQDGASRAEISGAPFSTSAVGSLLTCIALPSSAPNPPTFAGNPTFAYQWLREGSEIDGATSSTYTPVAADAGASVQCRVNASNPDGAAVTYSGTVVIEALSPKATTNPVIDNVTDPGQTPEVGDELSCSDGTWTAGPTFAYQWLSEGAEIPSAGSNTYVVTAADEGKPIQCRVTGTNAKGSTQAISNPVAFGSASSGVKTHPFLETFGSAAHPDFGIGSAEGVAVDQSTGDLLVINASAGSVSRWSPDGTPANFSALGTNVIDGQGGEDGGAEGLSFGGSSEVQIAVDNSGAATDGDIYVTQVGRGQIEVFASTGKYLGRLTEYKEGSDATGPLAHLGEACGVTVAPDGAVYVGDYSGFVHKYVPSGSFPLNGDNVANFSYSQACTLAAGAGGSAGSLFVDSYGGTMAKMNSSTGVIENPSVASGVMTVSVDPSSGQVYAVIGSNLKSFGASGATVSSSPLDSAGQGVAIRGAGENVYVSETGSTNISVLGPAVALGASEQVSPGSVEGRPIVGNTLSCTAGGWKGGPTFTYEWLRNGVPIGVTETNYTLTPADLGSVIQCRVTATNEVGSVVAINANAGARYVGAPAPTAQARRPDPKPSLAFAGLFGGHLFYADHNQEGGLPKAKLFSYDINSGATTAIAKTGDAAFVNVSGDGSHAYFVSPSQIDGEGTAGRPNLYVWSRADESTTYIATVNESDLTGGGSDESAGLGTWYSAMEPEKDVGTGRMLSHTRSTPDGSVLVFETTAQLTPFENVEADSADCAPKEGDPKKLESCVEVYRYDATEKELTCISCPAGEGPAHGEGKLATTQPLYGEAQVLSMTTPTDNVTDDGNMVVFETTESLVARDGNEHRDIYRWKKGAGSALISTGQDLGDSFLYAVSHDGSNIVFATSQQLLPQDENGSTRRLYDARVDGGFPPLERFVTEPCAGDVCQGAATAAPGSPQTASSSLQGEGDLKPTPKCAQRRHKVVHHRREACMRKRRHRHRPHRGRHRSSNPDRGTKR